MEKLALDGTNNRYFSYAAMYRGTEYSDRIYSSLGNDINLFVQEF
jgi:hypothetical protein